MLLAHEKGAELIVAVGTHFNLIEFLERNRAGMSSTFLTRLRVGEILVDAKGVSRLVSRRVGLGPFVALALTGLGAIVVAVRRLARRAAPDRADRAPRARLARPRLSGRRSRRRRSRRPSLLPAAIVTRKSRAWARTRNSHGPVRMQPPASCSPPPGRLGLRRRAVPPRRLVAGRVRRAARPARIGRRRALADRREPRADAAPQARARAGTLVVTASDRAGALRVPARRARSSTCASTWRRPQPTARSATITVEGPWLIAYRRTLARRAASRLYDLCQTAATTLTPPCSISATTSPRWRPSSSP